MGRFPLLDAAARHTFKFGAEIRHFQENFLFDSSARGTMNFTPFYTAQVSTTAAGVVNAVAGTGNAIADLLLGFPNTASVSRSFAGINANTVAGLRADLHQSLRAGRLPRAARI